MAFGFTRTMLWKEHARASCFMLIFVPQNRRMSRSSRASRVTVESSVREACEETPSASLLTVRRLSSVRIRADCVHCSSRTDVHRIRCRFHSPCGLSVSRTDVTRRSGVIEGWATSSSDASSLFRHPCREKAKTCILL